MVNSKEWWLVGALLAAPGIAYSQSVTLYGVVDTGVEYVNNIGTAKDSVVRVPSNTGTVPSRWGLRGSEDLGGGLKASFWLESGFAVDSGVSGQGGRLFGRQAQVAISGPWGQIGLGRQYTMLFWSTLDSDILGPNIFGSGSLDSYLPNARTDNSISYKGTFGGLTVGGTYSFGRDTVNAGPSPAGMNCAGENPADSRACREWSAMIQYGGDSWGVNAAFDSLNGGPGAFGGLVSSSLTDKRLHVGGFKLLANTKLGAGWIRRWNDGSPTPQSDLIYGGAAYDITPAFTLAGEAYYLKYRNSDNKSLLFAARGTYNFSKRTSVYGTVGYITNGGASNLSVSAGAPGSNTAPGGAQVGAMIGIKNIF